MKKIKASDKNDGLYQRDFSMSKTLEVSNYPKINPGLVSLGGLIKSKLDTISADSLTIVVYIILAIIVFFLLRSAMSSYWLIENPSNIRCRLNMFLDKYNKYGDNRSSRGGLKDYIQSLQRNGVPDSHLALTNFFVSSSNTPAFFTPIRDGIASPDAIRLTLAAGARYLDFEIWGDSKSMNYRPMVKGVDVGSNWRRITMTEMPFRMVMNSVIKYGMAGPQADADTNNAPYRDDPLFIMLHFRGKLRPQTFTETANILKQTIESKRLDFTYNKGRNMDNLFKVPISEFFGKYLIMSNVYPPEGNLLFDYINIGPRSSVPLEMTSKDIKAIPDTNKPQFVQRIQQNLTICRSALDEPDCDTNVNDWQASQEIGIHFSAQNFWSEDANLAQYLSSDNFGKYSFKIKPPTMRYVIEYIAPPLLPNPELNARDGKPNAPPNIILPA